MTNTLGAGGFEPESNPAERRAQFDLRRQLTSVLTRLGLIEGRVTDLETLTTPSAWTAVTYQNSWVDFGGSNQVVQYRKVGDIVYLRGVMKSGTLSATAFTLPTGFRPPASIAPTINTFNAAPLVGALAINSSGTCTPFAPDNAAVDINGIAFSVTA